MEKYIYVITTTITKMPSNQLSNAISVALRRRGEGKRSEICFTERQAERFGLNQQMQDLHEIIEDFGLEKNGKSV